MRMSVLRSSAGRESGSRWPHRRSTLHDGWTPRSRQSRPIERAATQVASEGTRFIFSGAASADKTTRRSSSDMYWTVQIVSHSRVYDGICELTDAMWLPLELPPLSVVDSSVAACRIPWERLSGPKYCPSTCRSPPVTRRPLSFQCWST